MGGEGGSPLEFYRAAGQALLHDQIVPALARAAPAADAPRAVDVVVTGSADPLQVVVERGGAGERKLSVSAGFLLFLETLVEAEVTARLLGREDALPRYVDDIVHYAGIATRPGSRNLNPGRFYRRVGMTAPEHRTLAASRAYQTSLSNNMVQTLAWIAAHRLTIGPGDDAVSTNADRAAARWTWTSGFAPFPLPSTAMLYVVALDPSKTESAEVRCRARAALLVSLEETRRALRTPKSLPRDVSADRLQRWTEMIDALAPAGSCRGTARPVP